MKRFKTRGGETNTMMTSEIECQAVVKIWQFKLSLSSQLMSELFWIFQIPKDKAVLPPHGVWQNDKLVETTQNLKWFPRLGVSDRSVWGQTDSDQSECFHSAGSFSLYLRSLSQCVHVHTCMHAFKQTCVTHTQTHTRCCRWEQEGVRFELLSQTDKNRHWKDSILNIQNLIFKQSTADSGERFLCIVSARWLQARTRSSSRRNIIYITSHVA